MLKRIVTVAAIVSVAMALSYAPSAAFGQATTQDPHAQMPGMPQTPGSSQMPDMMKMHEQMMADMHAAEVKLDQLVKQMNGATGDARIPAIAQVVTELANQQKAMHGRIGAMHEQMMGGRGMMMMPH